MQTEKHIVYIRHRVCGGDSSSDTHYWKIIEHSFPLEIGGRYSSDCDYLGGGSWCNECGEWIEKLEPYSPKRAEELRLADCLQPAQ